MLVIGTVVEDGDQRRHGMLGVDKIGKQERPMKYQCQRARMIYRSGLDLFVHVFQVL